MNTRLQVEHPVTEMVTGLDLVELMIRVAAGEQLPLAQQDVKLEGWAIEARVYAEDPLRGFLPSVGRLVRYLPPTKVKGVRVDTGVCEGGEVSMHYDPMIAKLITHGDSRAAAIERMREALNEFYVRGVAQNISFLAALIEHPRFRAGELSTNFIAEEYREGFHYENVVHDDPDLLICVAAAIHRRYLDRAAKISGQMPGYEREIRDDWVVLMNGRHHPVVVGEVKDKTQVVICNGKNHVIESDWQFGQPLFRGLANGTKVCIQVERRNLIYRLFHWGTQVDLMVISQRAADMLASMPVKPPPDMSKYLLSPMPGMLSQLMVTQGDEVQAGQHLAVVEAMKMENVLQAERDGVVSKVLAQIGDTLAVDQSILEFE
jgi:propionyl-CoA carboxylase alpha chain